jgi:hypothetical protein
VGLPFPRRKKTRSCQPEAQRRAWGKKGKKGRRPDGNKRKLEAVITEVAEAILAITDDTEKTDTDINSSRTLSGLSSGNVPADQFGRKAHEMKRILQNTIW